MQTVGLGCLCGKLSLCVVLWSFVCSESGVILGGHVSLRETSQSVRFILYNASMLVLSRSGLCAHACRSTSVSRRRTPSF